MADLVLTDREEARVTWACAWVRATPGLLPHLRAFLAARLARTADSDLAGSIRQMSARQIFRLWERIREIQAAPEPDGDPRAGHPHNALHEQSPREHNGRK